MRSSSHPICKSPDSSSYPSIDGEPHFGGLRVSAATSRHCACHRLGTAVSSRANTCERAQGSIAPFVVSLGVDRLDANLIGAGVEMRPEATSDRLRIAPEHHRIDEPV